MKRSNHQIAVITGMIFITASFPGSLFAQSYWLDQAHEKRVSIEILKPSFEGGDAFTFTTSAVFLSVQWPVSDRVLFVGELPFAHYGEDSEFSDESDDALGNPYLGLRYQKEDSSSAFEFGVRAPIASDEDDDSAAIIGLFTDFVERAEAFLTDTIPVTATFSHELELASGLSATLRAGPSVWIHTNDDFDDDTEFFLLYGAQAWYELEEAARLRLGGGVSGRWWLSSGDGDSFEMFQNQRIR